MMSQVKAVSKISGLIALSLLLTTCDTFSNEHPFVKVALSTKGLKPAPNGFTYEAWISLHVQPVSLGRFSIDESGAMSENTFEEVYGADLDAATRVFITLEPTGDDLPGPSPHVVIAGKFVDDVAHLSVEDALAFKTDFSKGKAGFIMQTPTDGASETGTSGIWFYNGSKNDPQPTLTLPELPEVWTYEAIFESESGKSLSLGTFPVSPDKSEAKDPSESQSESETQSQPKTRVAVGEYAPITGADSGNPYSSNDKPGPSFPGEDFFTNPPLDVRGGKLSINVRAKEEEIILFKIYAATLDKNAKANIVYPMKFTATALPNATLDRVTNP